MGARAYVVAGNPGRATGRRQERREHLDSRGLAGAVGSKQPEYDAIWHLQVDMIDRG